MKACKLVLGDGVDIGCWYCFNQAVVMCGESKSSWEAFVGRSVGRFALKLTLVAFMRDAEWNRLFCVLFLSSLAS